MSLPTLERHTKKIWTPSRTIWGSDQPAPRRQLGTWCTTWSVFLLIWNDLFANLNSSTKLYLQLNRVFKNTYFFLTKLPGAVPQPLFLLWFVFGCFVFGVYFDFVLVALIFLGRLPFSKILYLSSIPKLLRSSSI